MFDQYLGVFPEIKSVKEISDRVQQNIKINKELDRRDEVWFKSLGETKLDAPLD